MHPENEYGLVALWTDGVLEFFYTWRNAYLLVGGPVLR